jgi:hypothetical protein
MKRNTKKGESTRKKVLQYAITSIKLNLNIPVASPNVSFGSKADVGAAFWLL